MGERERQEEGERKTGRGKEEDRKGERGRQEGGKRKTGRGREEDRKGERGRQGERKTGRGGRKGGKNRKRARGRQEEGERQGERERQEEGERETGERDGGERKAGRGREEDRKGERGRQEGGKRKTGRGTEEDRKGERGRQEEGERKTGRGREEDRKGERGRQEGGERKTGRGREEDRKRGEEDRKGASGRQEEGERKTGRGESGRLGERDSNLDLNIETVSESPTLIGRLFHNWGFVHDVTTKENIILSPPVEKEKNHSSSLCEIDLISLTMEEHNDAGINGPKTKRLLLIYFSSIFFCVCVCENLNVFQSERPEWSLSHLAVHQASGAVYVGGVNRVYKLSSDLSPLITHNTGPELDNQGCYPPLIMQPLYRASR
ncbi:hypothetical protein QTP70_002240 [Hemibagrus guttatus]|uniref:Uncharacterized protein n=1 Tax=Hemibagrus guttatus TaxID=175788 RepID=A0AAE0UMY2_9TELE|nr:hypothetical protein QTP70_002240 [Hemibagrus guttatus]